MAEGLNPTMRVLNYSYETGELRTFVLGSVMAPGIKEENVKDILERFTYRDDDLFICTPPKSGSTWLLQIVKLIRSNGVDTGVDSDVAIPWFELMTVEELESLESPRAFKSHLPPHLCKGGDPKSAPAQFISCYRNPKDYIVSAYYPVKSMNQGKPFPFDKYMELAITNGGESLKHIKYWWLARDSPNVLLMCYEDIKKDLPSAVKQIATFMGYSLTDEVVTKIAEETTFDKMKDNPTASKRLTFDAMFNRDGSNAFLRKGVVGDWKNHLSEEQSAKIDALVEEHLGGTGLVFQYE